MAIKFDREYDAPVGPLSEVENVFLHIASLPHAEQPRKESKVTIDDIRALVKELGIKGLSIRQGRGTAGWPNVTLPYAYDGADKLGIESHYLRRDAVSLFQDLVESYFPSLATVFPDNPYQDGCYISWTVG